MWVKPDFGPGFKSRPSEYEAFDRDIPTRRHVFYDLLNPNPWHSYNPYRPVSDKIANGVRDASATLQQGVLCFREVLRYDCRPTGDLHRRQHEKCGLPCEDFTKLMNFQ